VNIPNYKSNVNLTYMNQSTEQKTASLVPVILKCEKKRGLGPRCDVTAKGASERLAKYDNVR
jgi:hypothetical protein